MLFSPESTEASVLLSFRDLFSILAISLASSFLGSKSCDSFSVLSNLLVNVLSTVVNVSDGMLCEAFVLDLAVDAFDRDPDKPINSGEMSEIFLFKLSN